MHKKPGFLELRRFLQYESECRCYSLIAAGFWEHYKLTLTETHIADVIDIKITYDTNFALHRKHSVIGCQ